ncbi:MAG: hypothetical protein M3Y56_13710 [Armatimonadota bacterium]|nr:hypothetical protein [Armatimonadota bacterium]
MATNEDVLQKQESDLIFQTMQDVEHRSIPIILLQAVQQNTRITEQIHGVVNEAKSQLDEVKADTKIVKADVATVKVDMSRHEVRLTNLEQWRAGWGRVFFAVFGIVLTGLIGYLFSFLPMHHH